MLKTIENLRNYRIQTTDGETGRLEDFYFDDKDWAVRYLVADIGHWLKDQKVLLSPDAFEFPDDSSNEIPVNLTKQEVADSPPIDANRPFMHHQAAESGWWPPVGRLGGGLLDEEVFGVRPDSIVESIRSKERQAETTPPVQDGTQLHSAQQVIGFDIQARDGEIGHVEDLLVHPGTWTIHYVLVDTRDWLPGKKVTVSPTWVETIDWNQSTVQINLTRETIQNSPEYEPSSLNTAK